MTLKRQCTWDEPFSLSDEGHANAPLLILGTPARSAGYVGDRVPQNWLFKPGREWIWLKHQAGGVACTHPEFVCTVLRWRPEMRAKFWDLARLYDGCEMAFRVSLTEINRYSDALKSIHPALSCEQTYSDLEEAVYPMDCTPEVIAALTDEQLPADLNDLVQWASPLDAFCGCIGRWRLWVLSENSD